jgi:ribosomal protein L7/L12
MGEIRVGEVRREMDIGVSAKKSVPIYKALREHKRILAIKLYREATGMRLAEAKDVIDLLAMLVALQKIRTVLQPGARRRAQVLSFQK